MLNPKRLITGSTLTTSYVDYYQVPTAVTSAAVKQLVVCNTDTGIQSFSLQVRPTGGADSVAYTLFNNVPLQPNESKVFGLTDVVPSGSSIYAKASVAGLVSITASGMEYI